MQLRAGVTVTEARSVTIMVFVFAQIAYLVNCRSFVRFRPAGRNPWLLSGVAIMVAPQLAITYLPLMNNLFHTAPLPVAAWPLVLGVAVAVHFVQRRTNSSGDRGREPEKSGVTKAT